MRAVLQKILSDETSDTSERTIQLEAHPFDKAFKDATNVLCTGHIQFCTETKKMTDKWKGDVFQLTQNSRDHLPDDNSTDTEKIKKGTSKLRRKPVGT